MMGMIKAQGGLHEVLVFVPIWRAIQWTTRELRYKKQLDFLIRNGLKHKDH
jgi:hypothetical protein